MASSHIPIAGLPPPTFPSMPAPDHIPDGPSLHWPIVKPPCWTKQCYNELKQQQLEEDLFKPMTPNYLPSIQMHIKQFTAQYVFTLCCCWALCCCCLWSLSASSSRSPMLFPAALPRDRAPAWLPLHPAPPDTFCCCWLCCRNFMISSCCWRHCCKTQTYKRVTHHKHLRVQQS